MSEPGSRTSRTDYTVLGCLSLGPMSGYDIKKLVDRVIGHFWSESYGQIYPSLKRLERDGLVLSGPASTAGRRKRREYVLTPAGVEELRAWLAQPAQVDTVRYEMSLKLFFGGQMRVGAARDHVERYRGQQLAALEEYRASASRLETEQAGSPHLPYWRIVLDGGIRYSEMAIEWCDSTLAELADIDPSKYPVDAPIKSDRE